MLTVLRQWHVMVGCDMHNELTATLPPVPAPMIPHAVGHVLNGWWTAQTSLETVKAIGTEIILRDSDILAGIPHVPIPPYPPCALVPLIMLTSGSKSYFGPSSVLAIKKPIACALTPIIHINLNCADPCYMPLDVVVAWGNVVTDMTFGDYVGGFIAAAIDTGISFGLGKLGGFLGKKLGAKVASKILAPLVEPLVGALLQQITGSPIGYTYAPLSHTGLGDAGSMGNWGGMIGHAIGDAINSSSSKSAEQHLTSGTPLGSPAPSSTPPAATNSIVNDPGVEDH